MSTLPVNPTRSAAIAVLLCALPSSGSADEEVVKIFAPREAEVEHRSGQPYDTYRDQWLYVKGDGVYRVGLQSKG